MLSFESWGTICFVEFKIQNTLKKSASVHMPKQCVVKFERRYGRFWHPEMADHSAYSALSSSFTETWHGWFYLCKYIHLYSIHIVYINEYVYVYSFNMTPFLHCPVLLKLHILNLVSSFYTILTWA